MIAKKISFLVLAFSFCSISDAADRGQGRLFLGSASVSPSDANTALQSQGMEEFKMNNQLGVEITLPALKILQAGFRYTHRPNKEEENPANAATDYTAELNQQVFMGVARLPLVDGDVVKFDFVLGAGAATTELKLKTAGIDGSLEKKGSPVALAGATVGIGFKKFFFTVEGGYEYNKVSSLKAKNMTSNVDSMDLSGGYLLVGLLFNDVPVFTK